VAQGVNFTRRFVGDRLSKADPTPVSQLALGEARILQVDDRKLAIHRTRVGRCMRQGSREFPRCDHENSAPVIAGRSDAMASRWARMR
jgi:hypothetical protein